MVDFVADRESPASDTSRGESCLPTRPALALVFFCVLRATSTPVFRAVLRTWRSRQGYGITVLPSASSSRKDCDHCRECGDHRESQESGADRGRAPSQPVQSCDQSVRQVREEADGIGCRPTWANLVPEREGVDYRRYCFDRVL